MFTFKAVRFGTGDNKIEASVVLSDGTIAGIGWGADNRRAALCAAMDCARSGDERIATAGRGHMRQVDGLPA